MHPFSKIYFVYIRERMDGFEHLEYSPVIEFKVLKTKTRTMFTVAYSILSTEALCISYRGTVS